VPCTPQFERGWGKAPDEIFDREAGSYYRKGTVGGRPVKELDVIADERANEVIKQLPGLRMLSAS
jgi:hypothetical protein